ncbi:Mechanosensitive ion channel protein 8 [Cucumispora dikerogammari]|nr:Mechanosensitive ion channel protein 8 [Cucumispora dikerogammari]
MFDWFDDVGELDEHEYKQKHVSLYLPFNYIYQLLSTVIWNSAVCSLTILILIPILGLQETSILTYSVWGISLNMFCLSTLFFIISLCIKIMINLIKWIKPAYLIEIVDRSSPWISSTVWFLVFRKFLLNYEEFNETEQYFRVLYKIVKCGLVTSASCLVLSVYLRIFVRSFIKSRVEDRIKKLKTCELGLSIFRRYRDQLKINEDEAYEEPETSPQQTFFDAVSDNLSIFEDISKDDDKNKDIFISKKPEIRNLKEAQKLAKTIFENVSCDGNFLTLKDFINIFGDTKTATKYFNRFDFDNNQQVDKEEFRNTIIQFYLERGKLEKSVNVSREIVNMINLLITCVYAFIMVFVYLIICGLQLKKLLAVSFSSAILINFAISKVAKHFYKSLLLILTHPYDIEDELIVEGEFFIVKEIGLATTSLLSDNGATVKFLNSEMWKKNVFNLTRSPEQLLIFHFSVRPETDITLFSTLKKEIKHFLSIRRYDYFSSFSLRNQTERGFSIERIDCAIILRNKSFKTRSKKLYMRIEFTKFLLENLKSLGADLLN